MQYLVVATMGHPLVTLQLTWKLLTMLDQITNPTQSLVTFINHLLGMPTTPKAQTLSSAEVRNSLHRKLKFCILSRSVPAL